MSSRFDSNESGDVSHVSGPSVDEALARLVGGDPLAFDLVRSAAAANAGRFEIQAAVALWDDDPTPTLARADALASTRRERQFVAVVRAFVGGDVARSRLLARQHLAEFPQDVMISWLASQG